MGVVYRARDTRLEHVAHRAIVAFASDPAAVADDSAEAYALYLKGRFRP